jgi:hypothetical protein
VGRPGLLERNERWGMRVDGVRVAGLSQGCVKRRQRLHRPLYSLGLLTYQRAERGQDAADLLLFGQFQFADAVVDLDGCQRLDE